MRCAPCIERHGGTVEKFIGDAIMAVFGLPPHHEDDALRAVPGRPRHAAALARSSTSICERALGRRAREADRREHRRGGRRRPDAGQHLVTGDAVNAAARLEQAAADGRSTSASSPTGWCATRSRSRRSSRWSSRARPSAWRRTASRVDRVRGADRRRATPAGRPRAELAGSRRRYREAVQVERVRDRSPSSATPGRQVAARSTSSCASTARRARRCAAAACPMATASRSGRCWDARAAGVPRRGRGPETAREACAAAGGRWTGRPHRGRASA